MADTTPSLQDVLRRRRRMGFVGRRAELDLFERNLALPVLDDRRHFVFNVYGEGGVGKSTLLEQWRTIAEHRGVAVAQVDEHVYGVPEALAALAAQFGKELDDFRKANEAYHRAREQLERDPQTPADLWSRLTRTAVRTGLHASKALPGAAPIVELVDGPSAAEAVDDARMFLARKLRRREIRMVLSPLDELTPPFVAGLNRLAAARPVALFFDTYEQTGAFLDGWLVDLITGRYGELPGALVVAVAGRAPLDPNRWASCLGLVAKTSLHPFTDAEARTALHAAGVTNERTVEVILRLSGRLPLLIDTLAKTAPSDPDALDEADDTAVERFLKWEKDPVHRAAALDAALPRLVDADVLAALSPDLPDGTFDWLIRQPFVSLRAGRHQYHPVVRAPMLRLHRGRSPQSWRDAHVRLADHHHALLADRDVWSDEVARQHYTEETYHRLCADEHHLDRALTDARLAARDGVPAARQWAEMLLDAGRDAASGAVTSTATVLLSTVGDAAPDCVAFLTAVIDTGHLTGRDLSELYHERARVHYHADRFAQAETDCTTAIARFPDHGATHGLRGAARLWMGRYDDAIVDFTRAIDLDPRDPLNLAERGEAHRLLDHHDEAIADLTRAIDLDPQYSWAIASRAHAYFSTKRYDDALTDFDRAVDLDPRYSWAIAWRGRTYRHLERYEDAVADFTRAIEIDASDVTAYAWRGETHRLRGRYDEAVADLTRAVELDPTYDWAWAERGETHRLLERYEDAKADLTRAIEIDPRYSWAIATLGQVHTALGHYDDALTDFDRAVDLDPGYSWAFAWRGRTRCLLDRHDEAMADLTRAIEIDPSDAAAYAWRGETHRLRGRYDEAVADLTRAVELDPTYDWAWAERGEAHRRAGRLDAALADFTRAADLDPEYGWAIGGRGQTLAALDRYGEAVADLTRAAELRPDTDWVYTSLGAALLATGRYREAVAALSRALELDAEDPRIGDDPGDRLYRARAYLALGDWDRAAPDLDRAIELAPGDPRAYRARADLRRRLGRDAEAEADEHRADELDGG